MTTVNAQHADVAVSANEPLVLREDANGVARLTLNRPKQFNALSEEMLDAVQAELDRIAEDEAVRVVVIGGAGRAFCAGHDLKQMRSKPDQDYYRALFAQCSRMMMTLHRLPQPVIARVHGIATAAGCQLVGACDLAVASTEAKFATSGINVGLFCSTPAVEVSRNLAQKPAFEMLITGDFIDAETAKTLGLINRVAAPDALDTAVDELCGQILRHSQVAVSTGKRMFYEQLQRGVEDAYAYASEVMACNMMAEDVGRGVDAFIAKEKPEWVHK